MWLSRAIDAASLYAISGAILMASLTISVQADSSGTLTTGSIHTCALTSDGIAKCWGEGSSGQLGNGRRSRATPAPVLGLGSSKFISAGGYHTCAVSISGGLYCWGENGYGQLGTGDTIRRWRARLVRDFKMGVAAVSAGTRHTCVLLENGSVKCSGYGINGELGNGGFEDSVRHVDVEGISGKVTKLAAGRSHTCALTERGLVFCWGLDYGPRAVRVGALAGRFTTVTTGGEHSCAAKENGRAVCWGRNLDGQLDGTPTDTEGPVIVPKITSITALTAGEYHSCGLTSKGQAWCWGNNRDGALGDGNGGKEDEFGIAPVWGLSQGVSSIASSGLTAGSSHTCARLSEGGIKCWGRGGNGQLGNGKTRPFEPRPVDVIGDF
jgi:alpha-tubulin suppressor-like RCC1 family protein